MSEMSDLGARCRGEQHDDVIGRQAKAIAELLTRIKELEQCQMQEAAGKLSSPFQSWFLSPSLDQCGTEEPTSTS